MQDMLAESFFLPMIMQHDGVCSHRIFLANDPLIAIFLTAQQTQNVGLLAENVFYEESAYREHLLTDGQVA